MSEFQISKALTPDTLELDASVFHNKDELFSHMVSMLYKAQKIDSEEEFLKALYERENTGSTFMENYIAIPHGKSKTVKVPSIAFCRTKEPFLYESCGEKGMAQLVFMLAVPQSTDASEYLKILATLSRLLVYEEFVEQLFHAKDYSSMIQAAEEAEKRIID